MTRESIDAHGIDLVARGDDLDAGSMAYWYAVPMQMGILRLLPYTGEISSTIAIGRIISRGRPRAAWAQTLAENDGAGVRLQ